MTQNFLRNMTVLTHVWCYSSLKKKQKKWLDVKRLVLELTALNS